MAGGAGGGGDGGNTGTSTGTTTQCDVDQACAVSFKNDIFPMLDTTSKCANVSGCHADGQGSLVLVAGDAASYYEGLTTYQLDNDADVGPYIVPCAPEKSKLTCNLKIKDGANPNAACGVTMPLVKNNAPTLAELKVIEDWITCGAPNN